MRYDASLPDLRRQAPLKGDSAVRDFMIGLAFVAMLIAPAILATIQKAKSRDADD
jgi:hypothetical protein